MSPPGDDYQKKVDELWRKHHRALAIIWSSVVAAIVVIWIGVAICKEVTR